LSGGHSVMASPLEWLREYLDQHRNYFADLDAAAEALAGTFPGGPEGARAAMVDLLRERHGIMVRVVPQETLAGTLRHYDFHRRRLLLSERLPEASRTFGIAFQLAQAGLADVIAGRGRARRPEGEEATLLARVAMTDYAAAALVMPYERFREAAAASRHDMDLLCARFGASYEQVAHRLATLEPAGRARGCPSSC
jgi:predicted transcriptional regulator